MCKMLVRAYIPQAILTLCGMQNLRNTSTRPEVAPLVSTQVHTQTSQEQTPQAQTSQKAIIQTKTSQKQISQTQGSWAQTIRAQPSLAPPPSPKTPVNPPKQHLWKGRGSVSSINQSPIVGANTNVRDQLLDAEEVAVPSKTVEKGGKLTTSVIAESNQTPSGPGSSDVRTKKVKCT